jgi:thymidylate synthase (FAD)
LSGREEAFQRTARDLYEERLKFGVAREQARKDLPLSTYTEAYWKCDLHNLLHFLGLRMDGHAQKEIRDFANTIGNEIVAKWVPLSWEAFNDYRMSSMSFSRMEAEIFAALAMKDVIGTLRARKLAEEFGWLELNDKGKMKTNRERSEAEDKFVKFGFQIPWKV